MRVTPSARLYRKISLCRSFRVGCGCGWFVSCSSFDRLPPCTLRPLYSTSLFMPHRRNEHCLSSLSTVSCPPHLRPALEHNNHPPCSVAQPKVSLLWAFQRSARAQSCSTHQQLVSPAKWWLAMHYQMMASSVLKWRGIFASLSSLSRRKLRSRCLPYTTGLIIGRHRLAHRPPQSGANFGHCICGYFAHYGE